MGSVSASPGILCLKPIAEEPEPEEHDDHTDSQSTSFGLEPPSSAFEADESGTCTLSSRSSSSSMTIAVPGNSVPYVLLSLAAHWVSVFPFLAGQTLVRNPISLLGRSLTLVGGEDPLRVFGTLPVGYLRRLFEGYLSIPRRVLRTILLLLHFLSLLYIENSKGNDFSPPNPFLSVLSARAPKCGLLGPGA